MFQYKINAMVITILCPDSHRGYNSSELKTIQISNTRLYNQIV